MALLQYQKETRTPEQIASDATAATNKLSGVGVKAINPTTNVKPPSATLPKTQVAPIQPGTAPIAAPQYTPPNQGTSGVSQGGIIGNLINFAQNESPEVKQARTNLQGLQEDYGQQNADILSRPEGLSQQTGQQGILQGLFANKQNAAQTALSSALTSQQQQIGATQGAGTLNAPVIASPGQVQINPSAPGPGSTTSGASLNSLVGSRANSLGIGTRIGADGHTTEYFDKSTGKGFSTPQALADFMNKRQPNLGATPDNVFDLLGKEEFYNKSTNEGFSDPQSLADFVNKEMPNSGANAQNVFDIIKQQGQGGSNIIGGDSSLNPVANIPSLAQAVINGQISYSQALQQGGSVSNFPGALTAEILKSNPSFNFNAQQGAASAQQSNTQGANTAATEAARNTYVNAYPAVQQLNQALNNVETAGSLTVQNAKGQNLNPFAFVPLNETINSARGYFSSSGYAVFKSNMANLEAAIKNIYAANGGATPTGIESQINDIISGNIKFDTLKALINTAKQEGQGRLANAQATAQNAFNQTQSSAGNSTNGSSSIPTGQTAAGGSLVWNGSKWVVK